MKYIYFFLLDNLLETRAKMLENMQISAQVRENLQYPVVDVQEVHAIVEMLKIFLRVRRPLKIIPRFPFNVKIGLFPCSFYSVKHG